MIPSTQKLTIEWSKWAWGLSMISEFSVWTVANTESPLAGCFFILEAFPGFLTSDTGFILRKDFWQLTALVLKILKKCINIPKVAFLCCYWVRLFWFSVMYMMWPSYSFSFLIHGKSWAPWVQGPRVFLPIIPGDDPCAWNVTGANAFAAWVNNKLEWLCIRFLHSSFHPL